MSAVAVGLVLALGLAACGGGGAGAGNAGGGQTAAPADTLVGVAMPTQTSERWIADGNNVRQQLQQAGYQVDLQYANDDIPTQSQQIDQMITRGAKLLIVAAIDGTALSSQLQAAASQGIKVIAYDRLIRSTPNVDFYVTFDNFQVGVAQANALLTGLGYKQENGQPGPKQGPSVIELFGGSIDDNNALYFYNGAMSVLKPLIDNGTLVVKSNQTALEQIAILRWQQETAQKRMEDLLTSSYADGTVINGVLSPYDGISRGIITALQNAGYGTPAKPLPTVTGQDAEIASVNLISTGVQSSTIFKDTRKLAEQAVNASKSFLSGQTPQPNDTTSYNNGVKVVPSFLLPVQTVYRDNITPVLVDTGYYTPDEIAKGQSS
ncbi:multiple monosaccharide ABC transporter substrate-binding protein [Actinomycetospora sp. CA-084318]|uniref:multiple monosaccharide ABC transporter substrate-binding protein n=1 Tax=Actinomycetospora sp. CA-084318 TaxID=3239892 RepID=UPI003D99FDFD